MPARCSQRRILKPHQCWLAAIVNQSFLTGACHVFIAEGDVENFIVADVVHCQAAGSIACFGQWPNNIYQRSWPSGDLFWPLNLEYVPLIWLLGCPSRGLDLLPGHSGAWLKAGGDLRADDQQWACEEALQQPCSLNCTPQAVLGKVLLQGRLIMI